MKEKEKIRLSEEELQKRMFFVNDKKLFNLRQIYFNQVDAVCRPVLEKAGYWVKNVKLRWLNISPRCPFVEELRYYASFCGLPCLFTFEVGNSWEKYLAVYALYSSHIYLLREGEYNESGYSETTLRLNIRYFFENRYASLDKSVYLYARVAQLEHTFFRGRPYLQLVKDLSTRKTVSISQNDLLEAFNNAYLFSEVFRSSELFSLTSQNREK